MEILIQQIDAKQAKINDSKKKIQKLKTQNKKLKKEIEDIKYYQLQKICPHISYTPIFKQRIQPLVCEEAKICTLCGYVCYLGIRYYDKQKYELKIKI